MRHEASEVSWVTVTSSGIARRVVPEGLGAAHGAPVWCCERLARVASRR
jgi:hypothetical protein